MKSVSNVEETVGDGKQQRADDVQPVQEQPAELDERVEREGETGWSRPPN